MWIPPLSHTLEAASAAMIEGYSPVMQALLGTLFTWGVTALGSAMVFVLDTKDQKFNQQMLDTMLVRIIFVQIYHESQLSL